MYYEARPCSMCAKVRNCERASSDYFKKTIETCPSWVLKNEASAIEAYEEHQEVIAFYDSLKQ